MRFFVDTADVSEIKALLATGLLDGVTTNPSLIAKSGRPILDVLAEICELVPGPVSGEVTATDAATMIQEGEKLATVAPNMVVKLPLTFDGITACHHLTQKGIKTNVTLCFSANQALLAAKAGATYISPFVGRLDDISHDGMQLINDIRQIYMQYPYIETQILVASIRNPIHLMIAAKMGAHVSTIPPKVIHQLFKHPLTDSGLEGFVADVQASGQSIL